MGIVDKIEYDKLYSDARKMIKGTNCMFCGRECTSFCHSHSLPHMILENLKDSEPGTFFWGYDEDYKPNVIKEKTGKSNAGLFFLICNDCDRDLFSNIYEKESILLQKFSNEIMQRIILKNDYYYYYKYSIEANVSKKLFDNSPNLQCLNDDNEKYKNEFLKDIQKITKQIKNGQVEEYEIIFWKKFDYVVPIAFQGLLQPCIDFRGNYIKDKLPEFHVVIFPLKNNSVVSVFCEKNPEVISKINFPTETSDSKKLSLINNMVLLFSEDFYLNRKVVQSLSEEFQKRLKKICYCFSATQNSMSLMIEEMERVIKNSKEYPNLLSKFNCVK